MLVFNQRVTVQTVTHYQVDAEVMEWSMTCQVITDASE